MTSKERIYGLDGLRGVAAIMVVAGHAIDYVPHFYLAVDFFFLLSGYVMARSYQSRLESGDRLGFLRERAIRLGPLLILGACLGAAVLFVARTPVNLAAEFGAALLCLPTFGKEALFTVNQPRWSLTFEVLANLAHAAAARVKVWMLAAFVVAAALALLAAGIGRGSFVGGSNARDFWVGDLRVAFSYSLGVLIWRAPAPRPGRWPFLVAAGAMVGVLVAPASIWIDAMAIFVLWPMILLGRREDRPGLSAGERRLLSGLGFLSYPLYILHFPILQAFVGAQHRFGLPQTWILLGFAISAASVAIVAGVFYDKPVRKWLSRRAPILHTTSMARTQKPGR